MMRTVSVLLCCLCIVAGGENLKSDLQEAGEDKYESRDSNVSKRGLSDFGNFDGYQHYWNYQGNDGQFVKTYTVTKRVPVPYPVTVERKIPYKVEVQVDRPYPVYVPKPYPVYVEKKIPYEVKVPVPQPYLVEKKVPVPVKVPVDRPYAVPVEQLFPIYVEKKVPYQLEKRIPYPIRIPVDRPYPVHVPVEKTVPYPVEKPVPYPVRVPVDKPVPVPVPHPVPYPVEKEVLYPVERPVPYPVPVPVQEPVEISNPVEIEKAVPVYVPISELKNQGFLFHLQNLQQHHQFGVAPAAVVEHRNDDNEETGEETKERNFVSTSSPTPQIEQQSDNHLQGQQAHQDVQPFHLETKRQVSTQKPTTDEYKNEQNKEKTQE